MLISALSKVGIHVVCSVDGNNSFEGECKKFMQVYMECLRGNKNSYEKCLKESKEYLQCRMER